MRGLIAVAALGLTLLAGCASERSSQVDRSPAPTDGVASRESEHVTVPAVVGLRGRTAASRLRSIGLTPVVRPGLMSACTERGVYTQRPDPGSTARTGDRVVVLVNIGGTGRCGRALPAPDRSLAAIADRFVAFAAGGTRPALAPTVDLHLGHVLVETRPAAGLRDPREWRVCIRLYAARSCPFSAVETIGSWPGRLASTSAAAAHPCAHPAAPPRDWTDLRRVTITPDEELSCLDYWAVELYVTPDGSIAATSVVWAEP